MMEGIANSANAMESRTVFVSLVPGPEGARAMRFQGNTFKDLKDRLADAKLTREEAYVEVLVDGQDYFCLLDDDVLPAGDLLARIYVGPTGGLGLGLPMRFRGHGRHGKMHHGPHHGPHGYGKDGAMHGPGHGECGKHAKKMHKLHHKMHKLHHKMGRHGPPFPHGPGFGRGGHHHGGMRHWHGPPPPPFGGHFGMMHHGPPGFGMHPPRPTCPGCEDESSTGTSSSSGTTSNDGSAPHNVAAVSEGVQGIVLE